MALRAEARRLIGGDFTPVVIYIRHAVLRIVAVETEEVEAVVEIDILVLIFQGGFLLASREAVVARRALIRIAIPVKTERPHGTPHGRNIVKACG
jgi:hypothetical protein